MAWFFVALAACGGGSQPNPPPPPPPPPPPVIVEPPPPVATVARQVSGVVVDSATQRVIADPLVVTVRDDAGQLSAATRDGAGQPRNVFEVANGIVAFAVDGAAALPLKLKVVVTGAGYVSTSADVVLDREGAFQFSARLVSVAAPPAGVVVAQQALGAVDSTGALAAPVSVATLPEDNTQGQTVVSIPAQTIVTTADGTPLAGALSATVSYYSNADAKSLAAFPGGLEVTVPDAGGARTDGLFISGGFTAIQVTDASGNVAAHFDKPVDVAVTVPAGTVNPATGLPVKAGDVVPFWSYSEATGQWSGEGTVTLADDGHGNFQGIASVTHLSYFNIDWFEQPCNRSPTIHIVGNGANAALELELTATGGGFYKRHALDGPDPNDVTLLNAGLPSGREILLTALFAGQPVGSVKVADLCTAGTVTLPVTLPTVSVASLRGKVERACQEDPAKKAPVGSATVAAFARGAAGMPAFGTTDANGEVTFAGLVAGTTYDVVYSTLEGAAFTASATLAAGANDLALPIVVACQSIGHAPAISSLSVPAVTVAAGSTITLRVDAADADGDPLTYAWTQACADGATATFGSPAAAVTTWTALTASGTCVVTAKVSAKDGSDARSAAIAIVPASGRIDVNGTFIPRPRIDSVAFAPPGCTVTRAGADGNCAGAIAPGASLAGQIAFAPIAAADAAVSLAVADDCGGTASAPAVQKAAGTGSFTWKAPATPSVCLVSVTLTRDGLADTFPVAVEVGGLQ